MTPPRVLLAAVAAAAALVAERGSAQDVSVCLITKTDTNPFFVKMREGAQAKADELGVELTALAGREEGDNEGQVVAMESCIANGVDGILIVPTDSSAIERTVRAARDSGIFVIALDTPLEPTDAADATLATDNFRAGELIGQWARMRLGDRPRAPRSPTSTCCRVSPRWTCCAIRASCAASASTSATRVASATSATHATSVTTSRTATPKAAARRWRTACKGSRYRRRLHDQRACRRRARTRHSRPSARKRRAARIGRWRLPGRAERRSGVIGATAQQYPLLMASMGVEAIAKFAGTGERPTRRRASTSSTPA